MRGMTDADAIWRLDLPALAHALHRGEVTAGAAVEAHLARIAAVNPRLNAVTSAVDNAFAEAALRSADAADATRGRDGTRDRLHGVPFSVKENVDVEGYPTTSGARGD